MDADAYKGAKKVRAEFKKDILAANPFPECYICGKRIDSRLPPGTAGSFESEDVRAIANGGVASDIENLAPAHKACNLSKGKKPADVARRQARSRRRTSRPW